MLEKSWKNHENPLFVVWDVWVPRETMVKLTPVALLEGTEGTQMSLALGSARKPQAVCGNLCW